MCPTYSNLYDWTKRFYTKGTLRGVMISRLAKIPTLNHDRLSSLIIKWVNFLSCKEEKGGLKDIPCIAQNTVLFVDLL